MGFIGKSVHDLGCGYGDMLWRCWRAGATSVVGYEWNRNVFEATKRRLDQHGYTPVPVSVMMTDLNKLPIGSADIALCLSVLPYLDDKRAALAAMAQSYNISILECQYWGDGPGPSDLQNDDDMRELLRSYWKSVEWIGATRVQSRGVMRSIWRVE